MCHCQGIFQKFFRFVIFVNFEVDEVYDSVKTAQKITDLLTEKHITVKRLGEMCERGARAKNIVGDIRHKHLTNIDIFCTIAHVLDVSLDELIDNSAPYQLK